jgi:hypothetical protein
MAKIVFPISPTAEQVHEGFTYDGVVGVWRATPSSGGGGGGLTAETQIQIDDNELFSLIGL